MFGCDRSHLPDATHYASSQCHIKECCISQNFSLPREDHTYITTNTLTHHLPLFALVHVCKGEGSGVADGSCAYK